MNELHVSIFNSCKNTTPTESTSVDWEKICTTLSKPEVREVKDGQGISFVKLEPEIRKNANVQNISAVMMDIDDGTPYADIQSLIEKYEHLAYSTHSHTAEHPKYRILFPVSRNIIPSEWPIIWSVMNQKIGGHADRACKDAARFYYLHSYPQARASDAFTSRNCGEWIDPDHLLSVPLAISKATKQMMVSIHRNTSPSAPESPENIARVKSALDAISADCNYEMWRNIVWALASTEWICAEEIARKWSESASERCNEDGFQNVWNSFNIDGGIGLGTFFHIAKESGWLDPTAVIPIDATPQWMQELNNKFAWIEANASIFRLEFSDFIVPSKFKTQHDNQKIAVASGNSTRLVGIGSEWIAHSARRQHKALVMRPDEGKVTKDNCLNEWQGFAISPAPGNIKPFLSLLKLLISARKERRFVLAWMSHLVQQPDVKMFVSLAIWSHAQGVGKNLLFETLVSIIGSTHATVIGQAELTGDFNGWANRRIFVIGDEVSGSNKQVETDKLKGLITGTTNRINEKYQPAREVPNLMNFVFLSNHHDAIFVNDGDRRFFVWEILSGQLSEALTKKFIAWRDTGGLSALLYFLLNRDISNFNPKAPAPMTDAKKQMVNDNRSDFENWVVDLMASNIPQLLGRELVTSAELGKLYEADTQHKTPSSKAIVGVCKRLGAYARDNQVRIANGKKVRALALARISFWKQQPENEWAAEMAKPFKKI